MQPGIKNSSYDVNQVVALGNKNFPWQKAQCVEKCVKKNMPHIIIPREPSTGFDFKPYDGYTQREFNQCVKNAKC